MTDGKNSDLQSLSESDQSGSKDSYNNGYAHIVDKSFSEVAKPSADSVVSQQFSSATVAPTLSLAPTLQNNFLPIRLPPNPIPTNFNPLMAIPIAAMPIAPLRVPIPTVIPTPNPVFNVPTPTPVPSLSVNGITDPNNDASLWKEHYNEVDERKYWFNRVTLISTYDKPFCLKTPEERSIPPCIWKEYTTTVNENGSILKKKYYSNGSESL